MKKQEIIKKMSKLSFCHTHKSGLEEEDLHAHIPIIAGRQAAGY